MSTYDLLMKNGNIITMDGGLSRKRWLAVKDGLIAALGDRDDFSGTAAEEIDLGGRTLIPGLVESHAHVSMTGIGEMGIDLTGITTCKGILEAVEAFCAKDKSDTPVCGGNMLMMADMEDKRVPTRYELDEVSSEHPVMLVFWTGHGGTMNSKAVELANLQPEMLDVEKDGLFIEDDTSFHVIANIYNLFSDADFENIFQDTAQKCASRGITTIHSLDGMLVLGDRDTEILVRIKDKLPVEFINYTQTFDLERVQGYGLPRIGGCLCLDGSPPQFTAAYMEPYPAAPHTRGLLNFTDKELYEFIKAATKANMQTAFHAIGERAVDQLIYVYQQVDREIGIKHLRNRIEHFSLPSDRHIEMAAEMNIMCSAQPGIGNMLDGPNGNAYMGFVPEEKAKQHCNFARVMQNGVMVIGGSDSPVTPIDSLWGIDVAVNAHQPYRRVSLDDALKMYTINAAYASHQEDIKGSLETGKHADMVVLDKDPYAETGCINRTVITVEQTYKKGKRVFEI